MTFRQTASAAPDGDRAVLGRGLVHRDAHGDPLADRAQRRDARDGLLDELELVARERLDGGDRLVDLPGAVGVDAERDVRADRPPHRGQPPVVVAHADLDLHAREAGLGGRGRGLHGGHAIGRPDRGVDRHVAARRVGQHRRQRPAGAAAGGVPQRQVHGGQRLGQVGDRAAGVEQLRAGAPVAGGQDRDVALERPADELVRHAVVGLQRRRLAAAGDAVGGGRGAA